MPPDWNLREVIAGSEWFAGLPEQAIEHLAQAASMRDYPINGHLYTLGKPTTEIYCLLAGRVRLSISSPNGHEFALVDRDPGTWLGEPGLVNDEVRILDARLIERSVVLVIPREVVLEVGERYPLMYRNLFHHYQRVLRDFHELMAGILFYPLRARVAGRLLHLAEDHGDQTAEGVLIDVRVSQNDFARLALGSRQRVNGIFRDWHNRGLVESRGEHLLILDMAGLEGETKPFE